MFKIILLAGTLLFAQHEHMTVQGQGSLVNLRMEVGSKKAKLYLTGRQAAEINLEKGAKILNITAFSKDGKKEELRFSPEKGYYTVDALPDWKDDYTVEVKTQVSKKIDAIKLEVKPSTIP
jgi:hypothetical protein